MFRPHLFFGPSEQFARLNSTTRAKEARTVRVCILLICLASRLAWPQTAPARSFYSLPSSNGYGAVMADTQSAKIVHFREQLAATEEPVIDAEKSPDHPVPEYDETLLAIIGILDELKNQSHTASWLRAGGLMPGKPSDTNVLPSGGSPWFEDAVIAKGWTEKGRKALAALDIEPLSGVTVQM